MQSLSSSNYKGIDISHWDGTVDFERVKDSGIKIVYMKATQGETYVDPNFIDNAKRAKEIGLLTGYYHFFTATTEAGAINEAIHFVKTTKPYPCDCRMAIDIEVSNGLDGDTLSNLCRIFLEKVKSLSKLDVVIYTYTSFVSEYLKSYLKEYPLWIAEYGVSRPRSNSIWSYWIGFQYSDSGHVPGLSDNVDLDQFTADILLASKFTDSDTTRDRDRDRDKNATSDKHKSSSRDKSTTHKNDSRELDCTTYRVRPGDTLSYIAQMFKTTVDNIVRVNNIRNPNIIYVGQKLKICKYIYTSRIESRKETVIKYRVRPGDTLSYIAEKFHTTVEHLVELNHIKNPNIIYVGQIIKI